MKAGRVTADGRARVLVDGHAIPLLGLGVWQVPDGRECEDAVRWAPEAGYRHIDTAQAYGNERSVGRALRDSGVPREEIFITTKFYPARKDAEAENGAEPGAARRRGRGPVHHPLAGGRVDLGVGRDANSPRARLRPIDRRLELQHRRTGRVAGGRRHAARRQSGAIQPVRVAARPAGRLRGARCGDRGLQPARHGSPSR